MFNYESARATMVSCQLLPHKLTSKSILAAMASIAREDFVLYTHRHLCYADETLEILPGRYLWSAGIFARLLQEASLKPTDHVLDIAFGTGYSSFILAKLVQKVTSLESDSLRVIQLKQKALEEGVPIIHAVKGPLNQGWPEGAPYDVIFFQGAVESVPLQISQQVKEGGKIVMILHPKKAKIGQAVIMTQDRNTWHQTPLFEISVPVLPEFKENQIFSL